MKFKDIPQYTNEGSYQVNISLKRMENWIEEEVKEQGLNLCPDFQRGHVWDSQKQIKFIEFFFRGGRTGRIIYFNCPDWGDFSNRRKYNDMVLVDGLQRITAIRKFLNNEIKIFNKYFFRDFEDGLNLVDHFLIFNVNNLQTKKEVLYWYIEMNEGGVVHTEEELNKVKLLLKEEE